jgi:hypothetical protein
MVIDLGMASLLWGLYTLAVEQGDGCVECIYIYIALSHVVVLSAEVFGMEVKKILTFHVLAHSRGERLYLVVMSVSQGRMMRCVVIAVNGSREDDVVRCYCGKWF